MNYNENIEQLIINIFNKAKIWYKENGYDLDYMNLKISGIPVHKDGSSALYELSPNESGGSHTNLGYIQINPDPYSVMQHYGIENIGVENFLKTIISHELCHEAYDKLMSDEDIVEYIIKIRESRFNTVYLQTYDKDTQPEKWTQEAICEYFGWMFQSGYEPPYSLRQIYQNYGKDLANKLSKDEVHSWRMETGIELIHKEQTFDEFNRIWINWQKMTDEMKKISDQKSIELFGITNSENFEKIIIEYQTEE